MSECSGSSGFGTDVCDATVDLAMRLGFGLGVCDVGELPDRSVPSPQVWLP